MNDKLMIIKKFGTKRLEEGDSMLALYVLVAISLAVIAFIVWSALYVASQSDEQFNLVNEDKLRKQSENLRVEKESED